MGSETDSATRLSVKTPRIVCAPEEKQSRLYANLFTFTAIALCLVVLLFVPQVRQVVWSQVPPPGFTGWAFAWGAFFLFLVIYFVVVATSILIVPRPHYEGKRRLVAVIHKTLGWTIWLWNEKATIWPKTTIVVALVSICMGVLSLFLYGPQSDSSRWFLLAGALCHNVGIWLLMFGAWLLLVRAVLGQTRFESETIEGGPLILLILGRVLAWLFLANIVGEALWAGASISWLLDSHWISFRVYLLWAVLHIMALIVIVARILDYLDRRMRMPVRAWGLAGLFILAVGLRPRLNADIELVATTSPYEKVNLVGGDEYEERSLDSLILSDRWYQYIEDRLAIIPEDDPVVIVAASGGGSRAALFTALVLEFLSREPIRDSAGASAHQESRTWADNVLLISSVSGGSLATGHFVARGCTTSGPIERSRYTIHDELVDNVRSELAKLGEQKSASRDSKDWEECRQFAENIRDEAESVPMGGPWAWLVHSAFADDMGANYMAPILRGSTAIRLYRGDALARFWSEIYGWKDCDNLDGYHGAVRWVGGAAKYPAVLFNATDVAKGSRLVIGFPPLPYDVFPEWKRQPKLTHYPPQELAHLFVQHQPRIQLTKAIRLSSNFPWGFYSSSIEEPGSDLTTLVLDGGIVDNTGLDTVAELTQRLQLTPRGRRLIRSLSSRRVVLIEVDSGAKPTEPSAFARLFGGTLEPIQALSNAAYTNADRAREHYVAQIRSGLALLPVQPAALSVGELKAANSVPSAGTLFSITVKCNHFSPDAPDRGAVMTAWALNPRDKASVVARFVYEIPLLQKGLRKVEDQRAPVKQARQLVEKLESESSMERLAETLRQENERSKLFEKCINHFQTTANELEMHYLRAALVRQEEIVRTAREALQGAADKRAFAATNAAVDQLAESVKRNQQSLGMDVEDIEVAKTFAAELASNVHSPITYAQESVKSYVAQKVDFSSTEREALVIDLDRVKKETQAAGYQVEQISKQSQAWFDGADSLKASAAR
jgi:hypothetical protein